MGAKEPAMRGIRVPSIAASALQSSEDANYAGSLLSDPTEAPLTEYAR